VDAADLDRRRAQGTYPPVANGFLDLETAWREVLHRFLGIEAARPDAVALLLWAMDPAADPRLAQLPAPARVDVMRWLGETAGVAGEMVLGCVDAGRTADALPLGLVCGVVFAQDGEGQASLGQAAIRLERFVNGKHVGVAEGRAWARAAEQVVRLTGLDASRAVLDRADALLRDLRVIDFAHLSDVLPAALDQRLEDFALALTAHVAEPSEANLAQVELQADRALRHTLVAAQKPRMERVEMARRLARWLMNATPTASSLQTAVAWQSDQGAFVDWARFRLLGGDELPDLSQAYSACREAVIARRNAFAKPFAQALVQWNAQKPAPEGRIIPMESVLEHVLAPIAAAHPTLLLVMDGLSTSIFRELFARIASHGWAEMVPSSRAAAGRRGRAANDHRGEPRQPAVWAADRGRAAQEKTGFATHAALLAHSRADAPPRLFHKGDLAMRPTWPRRCAPPIASTQQRVVGVVYNAVDDHLSGPDQLHQRWALEDLRLLLPLLREAREARRVVVITADHGHLLEDGTTQLPGGESDRWRPGKNAETPNELAVSGGRVVTSDGSNAVVCLWGESTRYAGRKNGYHGGLSPQESRCPERDRAAGIQPGRLDPGTAGPTRVVGTAAHAEVVRCASAAAAAPKPTRRKPTAQQGQPQLFEPVDLPPPEAQRRPWRWTGSAPCWQSDLCVSAAVGRARSAARRQDATAAEALSERGGKLSRAALANRLSLA
jgi:hypothetical protein